MSFLNVFGLFQNFIFQLAAPYIYLISTFLKYVFTQIGPNLAKLAIMGGNGINQKSMRNTVEVSCFSSVPLSLTSVESTNERR